MLFPNTNIGRLVHETISMEKTASKKSNFDPSEAIKVADGLEKISSYQYNEKVYESVQEIMKIASKCLNNLKSAYDQVMEKNAKLEKAAEIQGIVEDMAINGLIGEHDMREKIAELAGKNDHQLEVIKEATKLAGCGKSGNVFSSEEPAGLSKTGSAKRGMFDTVLS